MREFEILRQKALAFNIELSNEQMEKFREYLALLENFNRHTNLISSTDPQTVVIKHFLDSLAPGPAFKETGLNRELKLIDIGTGGGFPGIPLLIAFEDWKLYAVDSIAKKLEFIGILCEKLGLSERVEIVCVRAEELGKIPGKREAFDFAVTRAVAQMSVISEYCLPLVREGGYFAAYKAKSAEQELKEAENAISMLGGKALKTFKYTLTGEEERNLIIIKKVSPTPRKYPRRTGVPVKRPLSGPC